MVQRFSDYALPLIASFIIHLFIIGIIFISLTPEHMFTFQKKKATKPTPLAFANTTQPTPLPAPVVLYYANTPQSQALPPTKLVASATEKNPLKDQPATTKSNPFLENLPPEPLQKPEVKKQPVTEKKSLKKEEETQKKKSTNTISVLSETGFFKVSEAPIEHSEKKESADASHIRRRQLELADLFKTMPHYNNKTEGNQSGSSDQLVVVQGDMKYYSFFNQFLTHINQVFAFYGGPEKFSSYIQSGKQLKNAALFVIIDQQGKVLSRSITSSSGYAPADALILQAVDQASPFPPVPQHFNHKTVRIELISMIR